MLCKITDISHNY